MNRIRSGNDACKRARGRTRRRRGTILIIAMVILLILMIMSSTLISSVIQSRTQLIREEHQLQTALLAEAGIARGVAQLRSDQSFRNETWQIPAESDAGLEAAKVTIVVADADPEGRRTVSAVAEYPQGMPNPIRITRELSIPPR